MATVGSAFHNHVADGARSFFLENIPEEFRAQLFDVVTDLSSSKPGESFAGTAGHDLVTLGNSDYLLPQSGGAQGYDVVQTGTAIDLTNTGFSGAILTGNYNIGATGNELNNAIAGNAGNNLLKGGAGDDVMAGNDGNDRLDGGDGNDTLFGDAGDDVLLGGAGADLAYGGEGADKITGGADNDTLLGEAGNDSIWGDAGDDELDGGAGNDNLDGGSGNDSILGDIGDDILSGMAGDDSLFGGGGGDTLFGGYGSDTMTGDDGADIFVMRHRATGDIDVITDFDRSEFDVIDLSATGVDNFQKLSITDDPVDGNAVVTLPDGSQFKLIGYSANQVDEDWFQF